MALFVDYGDCSGGVAVLLEVALRHWEAYGVPVGCGGGVVGGKFIDVGQ